jgi:two-component system response regulator YesN
MEAHYSNAGKEVFFKIKDELEKNLDTEIHLSDLAKKYGLSVHKMTDGFFQAVGYTIWHYRLMSRMEAAKKMLRETKASINEVAFSINYTGARPFSKEFKKITGCTPTEYRRKHCKK